MLSICLAAAPHAQAEGERPAEVRAAAPLADGKAEVGWKDSQALGRTARP